MGLQPVVSDAHFDFDGDGQLEGVLHGGFDDRADRGFLFGEHVENDFVVNGQHHGGFELVFRQSPVNFDHGDFQNVRRRPLDRTVHGQTFGGCRNDPRGRLDVADVTTPTGFGGDVAVFLGKRDRRIDVVLDAGIGFEIVLDQLRRFVAWNVQSLLQTE